MALQVVMNQNETNDVLSLLNPHGWQKNSAPIEL